MLKEPQLRFFLYNVGMSKKQNGFGIVPVFVIVVVIGLAGWLIWSAMGNTSQNNVAPKNSATSQNQTNTQTKPIDTTKYLMIKEWGVKIPLSSENLGAYYTVDNSGMASAPTPTNLTVYSKETDALTGPAGISCKGEYVAYLMRLPSNDLRWQQAKTVDDGNVSPLFIERITIGNYRYAVATHKEYGPDCFETEASKTGAYEADQTISQKFSDVVTAFAADFKNIQPSN